MITAKEAKSIVEKANLEITNKCKLIAEQDILPEIEKTIIKVSSEGKSKTKYFLERNDISFAEKSLIMNTIITELEKAGYVAYSLDYYEKPAINIVWYYE